MICRGSAAIRCQKRLIEGWLETAPAVGIQASIDAFSETFDARAANERLSAFRDRPRVASLRGRKPKSSGR